MRVERILGVLERLGVTSEDMAGADAGGLVGRGVKRRASVAANFGRSAYPSLFSPPHPPPARSSRLELRKLKNHRKIENLQGPLGASGEPLGTSEDLHKPPETSENPRKPSKTFDEQFTKNRRTNLRKSAVSEAVKLC